MTGWNLASRVATVTGAGRGLGRAMALGLARAGARVVATAAREAAEVEATAALERFGRLDTLVNNAGRGMRNVSGSFMTEPTRFWEVRPRRLAPGDGHQCQRPLSHGPCRDTAPAGGGLGAIFFFKKPVGISSGALTPEEMWLTALARGFHHLSSFHPRSSPSSPSKKAKADAETLEQFAPKHPASFSTGMKGMKGMNGDEKRAKKSPMGFSPETLPKEPHPESTGQEALLIWNHSH